MSIRQILNGTSGIFNYTESPQHLSDIVTDYLNGSTRKWQPEEVVAYSYDKPLFSGRSSSYMWTYPNTGNILAGMIIEKATGLPYMEVLRAQVLEPLGLKNTFMTASEPISGNLAQGYADYFQADGTLGLQPDGSIEGDGVLDNLTQGNITWAWANGGLAATAQDLARFSQALFSGELLNRKSLSELLNFVNEGIPFEGDGYGLGVVVRNNDNGASQSWGKGGKISGYEAEMRFFPDRNGATVTVLSNQGFIPSNNQPEPIAATLNTIIKTLV